MSSGNPSKNKAQLIVGLMSGTSADGIEAVVAAISRPGNRIRAQILHHLQQPFAPQLRNSILHVSAYGTVGEICELNFVLGAHFAKAALAAIQGAKLAPSDITAIGSHGQTIRHQPNAPTPSTLQIGEPAIIAERTGITTVADFRVGDMAAGGQGAPLVPFADWALFTDPVRPRIIQNIGGIANLTFLAPAALLTDVVAFDTGPGNMVIDAVVSKLSSNRLLYDRNGAWAARGRISGRLLKDLLEHPFLKRRPPKTTGREEFGELFMARVVRLARMLRLPDEDVVATMTAYTAASIGDAYQRFVFPKIRARQQGKLQVILGGGGAKNSTLRRMLASEIETRLARRAVRRNADRSKAGKMLLTHEDFGIPNSAKEALAFAILAHETLAGRPGNVPSATGANRPVILGKIIGAL